MLQKRYAMTLVELMVVIMILALLAVIGIIAYNNYLFNSRDSMRTADLTRLSETLTRYSIKTKLPLPDKSIDITSSGTLVSKQGYLSENILKTIGYSEAITDPKDKTPYGYLVNSNRKNFQLMAYMEKAPEVQTSIGALGNGKRFPRSYGARLGMILTSSDLTPIQDIVSPSFELNTPSESVIIFIQEDEYIVDNVIALPTLSEVTSDTGKGWKVENNSFTCLDLDTPGKCSKLGLVSGVPGGSTPPPEPSSCYDPVSIGTIGTEVPCTGMLIVNNTMIRSVAGPNTGGNSTFALTGPDSNIYTFGNSTYNIFTGQVTDISFLFRTTTFNQPIGYWDTSNVINMSYLFYLNSNFNQDISSWKTSNVTNMIAMFTYASVFNQNLSSWDTSNVTDMSYLFYYASSFNQNLSSWDTSNVTNMKSMFAYTNLFNGDISSWNTSNVTDMQQLFYLNSNFNQDISSWNTSNVTNMNSMFYNANSFNQDISSWNVSKVTNIAGMFYNANSFNQDISSWNVSKVTHMNNMFSGATSFNQDISSWNVSNVIYMYGLFNNATSFNQDISSWNVGKVTSMTYMFRNATSFNQDLTSWITGATSQPSNFSTGANATWRGAKATKFPFLKNGTTRFTN